MDQGDIISFEPIRQSSPPRAVFSDESTRTTTPPSSPPRLATDQLYAPKAVQKPTRDVFSILGKRKALAEVVNNARATKKVAMTGTSSRPATCLTQMQISIGQQTRKRCKACGMEYVLSSTEDRKLHEKYHAQNTEGYDVGRDFVEKRRLERKDGCFAGIKDGDTICMIDRTDNGANRKRAHSALEIVQRELGAVEIPDSELWGVTADSRGRFQVYLYIRGTKCVGLLLAERIETARKVVEPIKRIQKIQSDLQKQMPSALMALKAHQAAVAEAAKLPIQLSKRSFAAGLGISRVWTSKTHRHQDIATSLLNIAHKHAGGVQDVDQESAAEGCRRSIALGSSTESQASRHHPGTAKEMMAFSPPTEAGVRLARRWFGRLWGWSVYVD